MGGATLSAEPGIAPQRAAEFQAQCSTDTAFRAWYDATLSRVYGYVYTRTAGDSELAEEITQQAFIAAARSKHTFDGRSDSATWVCSIARNALVDHYRHVALEARRHLSLVVREIAMDGDARAWTRLEARDEVLVALRGLTDDQRSAVTLHYLDRLPVHEIARLLKRSEGSVESLLARGRQQLRTLMEERP
jgi:RNA polymerase sigma-70 factor, ECF subfamily